MRSLASAVLAMVCGLLSAATAGAADTDDLLRIYMEELTRETKVPSSLAARLVVEARKVTDNPPLQIELYRKAYEYGMRTPAGQESAMTAAQVLLAISPSAKPEWVDKLVKVSQLVYARQSRGDAKVLAAKMVTVLVRAGDVCLDEESPVEAGKFYRRAAFLAKNMDADVGKNINEKVQRIQAFNRTRAKIEVLKKRLKDNPKDAKTRMALIRCCVVERDCPAGAAAQLDAGVPAVWRTNVPSAVKDPAGLDEATCFELGKWYVGLGGTTSVPDAKQLMFRRAGTYLRRFLDRHRGEDELSATAETMLRSIGMGQYAWINLLKTSTSSSRSSTWTVPLLPEGSYELRIGFSRDSEDASISIGLPLGRKQVSLTLSGLFHSGLSGLSAVDSKGRPTRRSTTWRPKLKTDVTQILEIRVVPGTTTATVSARLNGGAWHSWRGTASSSAKARLQLPGSGLRDVDIVSAKLRVLSGRVRGLME